ncbi:MAG TPA: ester cyclase [Thermoanaerobaculia bacterium]|jgi:predicted ester cyclase|nr:ester cyclase [Thermoanaerobaculia bacterium]
MARSLVSTIHAANTTLIVEGNMDAVGEFFTPDYVAHVTSKDLPGGHGGIRRYLRMLRHAFPSLQVEIEIFLKGKDRVAWQRTLRGVQRGDYAGFPATGRRIVWRDMFASRFREGLIAEDWVVTDLAERLLLARKR